MKIEKQMIIDASFAWGSLVDVDSECDNDEEAGEVVSVSNGLLDYIGKIAFRIDIHEIVEAAFVDLLNCIKKGDWQKAVEFCINMAKEVTDAMNNDTKGDVGRIIAQSIWINRKKRKI